MKIYTKTGDNGSTSLFGGDRLMKSNARVDAYGNIDELNSFIGLLGDHIDNPLLLNTLKNIQDKLFVIGSHLATIDEAYKSKIPEILEDDIVFLENQIDAYNGDLPVMTHFILPGGHASVSFCHVARTVCRRAERSIVAIAQEEQIELILIKYLNRLSDYLFVLARKLAHDLGIEEIKWESKKR